MKPLIRAAAALTALGAAACSGEADGPRRVPLAFAPAAPVGVEASLVAEHYPRSSFADVTRTRPEDSFAGAVVEGKSFQAPGDVYVLTVSIRNGSGRALAAPDLVVSMKDEPDVTFRPRKRTLAAGEAATLAYFWDPGKGVPPGSARLVWGP
jgi:hypothetical protein